MGYGHRPVMTAEVLGYLGCRPGGVYVDGTLGGGGHAGAILRASAPDGVLIGLDRDDAAMAEARKALGGFGPRAILVRAEFREMARVAREAGYARVDGVLLDLGVSSHQLDEPDRGFSFRFDAPLDMRMDRRAGVSAREVVNTMDEAGLAGVIRRYGEERFAAPIARAIVQRRRDHPIETTAELVEAVLSAVPARYGAGRIHPATRTFQALRIYVNDELTALAQGLGAAMEILGRGGRLVVISYHSLEDRLVKRTFREWAGGCTCPPGLPRCSCGARARARRLTRRVVRPGAAEVAGNPRARSARLRALEALGTAGPGD